MTFNGRVEEWKNRSNDNFHELSAKEFDGMAWLDFVKENGKPSHIEFDTSFNEKEMKIFVHLENSLETVAPGKRIIDLTSCKDGKYKITAEAKNAKNLSVEFKFI